MQLGVTGGIGSGKTSVCRVFNTLGIPVFSADPEARSIMENEAAIIKGINSIAGRDVYPGGKLDRMSLAKLIFNDPEKLKKVNALVHPAVFGRFIEWAKGQSAPYVIIEAAILFESGGNKLVDKVLSVIAPEEERIERVMHRNNLTREQVTERMRNQISDEKRIELSDYLVHNSENDMIIPSVLKIHYDILSLIKTGN
jgi:dephospho-CoA kinase